MHADDDTQDLDLNSDGLQCPGLPGFPELSEQQDDYVELTDGTEQPESLTATEQDIVDCWTMVAVTPSASAVARRGEDVERAVAEPQAQSQPKARRHFSEKANTKAGDHDPHFVTVWTAHQKRHEKWDSNGVAATDGAFGMAGAGNRRQAWNLWQELPQSEQARAAALVEQTIAWRQSKGFKLQQVRYFIEDRAWTQIPKPSSSPSPFTSPALGAKAAGGSANPQPTDFWKEGVRHWIAKGQFTLIPSGQDPDDWAAWPVERRQKFAAAVGRLGPDALERLARRNSQVHAWVQKALQEPAEAISDAVATQTPKAPQTPATHKTYRPAVDPGQKLKAVIRTAQRGLAVPRPRPARMTKADVEAYCRDVGVDVSPPPPRHRWN